MQDSENRRQQFEFLNKLILNKNAYKRKRETRKEMDEKYTSNMELSKQVLSICIKIPKILHKIHSKAENNYKTKRQ